MADPSQFDVIVVGGGAAGCVIAARLSESGDRTVLLLEAGPDLRADLPDEIRDGWGLSRRFDWGYASDPDEFGNVHDLRRIKLLGGTSWLTRFAVRGSPADFDEWEALGNPGWSHANILSYFKRLETDLDFGGQPWHGNYGPIPITRYPDVELTDIGAAAFRAAEGVGFRAVEDHNRPGAVGIGRMPMSSRNGIRVTTVEAYLPVGATLPNLTIQPDTQVASIVLSGTRATGVRLLDGTVVHASWVVLCAGTYGSPPILMRSGIGPADHLHSVGLPVCVDLPGVGANLADHPGIDIDCGYQGPSREAPVLHSIATCHSHRTSSDASPDLLLWLPEPSGDPPLFTIEIVLLKPLSRGAVRLRSAHPTDPPRIVLPGLREPSDLDRLVEGYRRGWEIAIRPEIRRLCAGPLPPEINDDYELCSFIRRNVYSLPHVVGTCAMGPSDDRGAVVDASGRVYGTEQLSVVDASIIPTAPSGFTHIPTIMIAERLAEEIAGFLH